MPKTDDGFQGFRPGAHGPTWDAMSSPQRRKAFWSDLILAVIGAAAMAGLFSFAS